MISVIDLSTLVRPHVVVSSVVKDMSAVPLCVAYAHLVPSLPANEYMYSVTNVAGRVDELAGTETGNGGAVVEASGRRGSSDGREEGPNGLGEHWGCRWRCARTVF